MTWALDILEQSNYSVARALERAISMVATPELTHRVIRRALHLGQRRSIPEDFEEAVYFVEVPLRAALEETLGIHVAGVVMVSLQPIIDHGESTERMRMLQSADPIMETLRRQDEQSRSGTRIRLSLRHADDADHVGCADKVPAAGTQTRMLRSKPPFLDRSHHSEAIAPCQEVVVFVSEDPRGFEALIDPVTEFAELRAYTRLEDLFRDMQTLEHRRIVCILDESTRRITSPMAMLLEATLPRDTAVILWGGAGPRLPIAPQLRWLECPVQASYRDVAQQAEHAFMAPFAYSVPA